MNAAAARSHVMEVKSLPPLSVTATRLLRAAADPEIDIDVLSGIIEQDPGLLARILGLANSAYFGQVTSILTVKQAIIRVLGLNVVKSLALSIAMAGSFDTSRCPGFQLDQYWYAALGSAQLARLIALQSSQSAGLDVDAAYLAGLLHNIGTLVLVHTSPEAYGELLSALQQAEDTDVLDLERRIIGLDHNQAALWLAQRWHLPEVIAAVIGELGNDQYQGAHASLHCVVSAASRRLHRQLGGKAWELRQAACLQAGLGIGASALIRVETRFIESSDELWATARTLMA